MIKNNIAIAAMLLLHAHAQSQTSAEVVDRIYRLPDHELYTDPNLEVLGQHVTSKDVAFKLYYPNGHKLDSLLGKKDETKRSSAYIVARVIADEEIWPELNRENNLFKRGFAMGGPYVYLTDEKATINIKPDWKWLEAKIKKKYAPDHAKRAILWSQMDFYRLNKDYNALTRTYLSYVNRFSARVYDLENSVAWDDIFGKVTDKKLLLKTAAAYKQLLDKSGQVNTHSNFLDTYANLLYKSGKVADAISWEQKAIELERSESFKREFGKTLEKMKQGLPTWNN